MEQWSTTGCFTTLDTQGLYKIRHLENCLGVKFMFLKGLGLSQNLRVSSVVKHPV